MKRQGGWGAVGRRTKRGPGGLDDTPRGGDGQVRLAPGSFTPLQLQTAREPAGDGAAQAGRVSGDGSRLRFCCAFFKERQHLPRPPRNPVRRRRGFAKGGSSFLYLPSYRGLSRRDLVHRGLLGKHRWSRGDVATWTGHGGPF